MLSHAISMPEEERQKPLPPPPADLLGELHLAAINLGKQRQQIAANVFRPGHNLPTRSLAEQVGETDCQFSACFTVPSSIQPQTKIDLTIVSLCKHMIIIAWRLWQNLC